MATFPSTQVSLTPEVAKLKSAGADVMFVAALGAPAGYAADGRAQLNWNVPIVYDLASSSADLTKLIKPSELHDMTEEIFRSNNASLNLPGAADLLAALKAREVGGRMLLVRTDRALARQRWLDPWALCDFGTARAGSAASARKAG